MINIYSGVCGKTEEIKKVVKEKFSHKEKGFYVGNNQTEVDAWIESHPTYKRATTPKDNPTSSLEWMRGLLLQGVDIATTWGSFYNNIDQLSSTPKLFQGYNLLLDNCFEVFQFEPIISREEIKFALKSGLIELDDSGHCSFRSDRIGNGDYWKDLSLTHFGRLQKLCDKGNLMLVNKSAFVSCFSKKCLSVWESVHISCNLFRKTVLESYLTKNMFEYKETQIDCIPMNYKHLINIYGYEDDMSPSDVEKKASSGLNAVGYKSTALSSSAINREKGEISNQLRKNLRNFFETLCKSKKDDRLWTSLKSLIKPVGDKRYQSDWLAFNTKATNDYGNVHNLAYLMNLYAQPFIVHASQKKGYPIDQDIYALSEMIQWIWRSAIRNGEEINLYIPSSRMRNLLVQWLNGGFVDSIPHTEIKTVV